MSFDGEAKVSSWWPWLPRMTYGGRRGFSWGELYFPGTAVDPATDRVFLEHQFWIAVSILAPRVTDDLKALLPAYAAAWGRRYGPLRAGALPHEFLTFLMPSWREAGADNPLAPEERALGKALLQWADRWQLRTTDGSEWPIKDALVNLSGWFDSQNGWKEGKVDDFTLDLSPAATLPAPPPAAPPLTGWRPYSPAAELRQEYIDEAMAEVRRRAKAAGLAPEAVEAALAAQRKAFEAYTDEVEAAFMRHGWCKTPPAARAAWEHVKWAVRWQVACESFEAISLSLRLGKAHHPGSGLRVRGKLPELRMLERELDLEGTLPNKPTPQGVQEAVQATLQRLRLRPRTEGRRGRPPRGP